MTDELKQAAGRIDVALLSAEPALAKTRLIYSGHGVQREDLITILATLSAYRQAIAEAVEVLEPFSIDYDTGNCKCEQHHRAAALSTKLKSLETPE